MTAWICFAVLYAWAALAIGLIVAPHALEGSEGSVRRTTWFVLVVFLLSWPIATPILMRHTPPKAGDS